MNQEEWRPISGYEGLYEISSYGRVRNRFGKILAQCNKEGTDYKRVHLCKNNVAKWHSVHRLVAKAFLPIEEGKDVVNHLDHDKSNNHVENLEWTTIQENSAYAAQEGRYHIPYENLKKGLGLLKEPVIGISPEGLEYVFESIAQAARYTGANRNAIARCCMQKYGCKTAATFRWRYAKDEEVA